MKFTSAALAITLSGSAMAGGADGVNAVLNNISESLKSFDSAIKSWSGGSADSLVSASKKIQSVTESGAQTINSGDSLTLVDAAGITANVQGLQTLLDGTLSDLQSIGKKLAAAGQCATIQSQLQSQGVSAQGLQDAITGKAPQEAKSIATQLGGQIGAAITSTKTYFADICAGAPSDSSSGPSGSAPKSSGSGAGSSGSPTPGGSGGHGSSGHGSSPGSGTGASRPATTTAVPKPATYAGAGSTVKVPFAVALGLAVFAL